MQLAAFQLRTEAETTQKRAICINQETTLLPTAKKYRAVWI